MESKNGSRKSIKVPIAEVKPRVQALKPRRSYTRRTKAKVPFSTHFQSSSSNPVMSSSPHSTIVPSDSDIENTFSSTNILNYIPASPRNISPDSLDDFTKYLLDILVFSPLHDDPYMKVIQAYDATPPPQVIISLLPPSPVLSLSPMVDSQDLFPSEKISSPKDTKTPISPSSSVRSSSLVRSTMPPPDYPFDEILESCKRRRTQKQQRRITRLEFSRI
ncbi:hypothetical protein Tco_0717272 [Tanacetum coccineum]